MILLFYAAVAIVTVNLFAAVVYHCLHRGAGLAISLVGTVLLCIGLTYAALNDVSASKPAPDVTTDITTPPTATTTPTPEQTPTIHPSLDPSSVSRETPSPTATPSKRPAYAEAPAKSKPKPVQKKAPVARKHFDDMEKQLSHTDRGTDPGAGGCDDAAAGGCKR